MAITSGFFDSVEKDRLYNASQLSECFSGIVSDGVFRRVGDSFGVQIQPGTMKLTVGTGRALVLGRWIKNDSSYTVTFSAADSESDRIDSIAIGCDMISRECSIYVKKGVPARNPAAPEPVITESKKELIIANVRIKSGSSAIELDCITDMRSSKQCGYVNLQAWVDTSTVYDAGEGLSLDESTNTFSLAPVMVSGGRAGEVLDGTFAWERGYAFPFINYDEYGRITSTGLRTMFFPQNPCPDSYKEEVAGKFTGVNMSLNSKADKVHKHFMSDVTGLESALLDKSDKEHTHTQSDITGLETALSGKVDKVSGKGLSSNDYTTAEKEKLAGIAAGANKTVVDSALNASSTNPVQNKAVNTAVKDLTDRIAAAESVSAGLSSSVQSLFDSKSDKEHTHNYAGSSSAGGAATTALACTGNSASATKLATARTINGVSFDGTSNIYLPSGRRWFAGPDGGAGWYKFLTKTMNHLEDFNIILSITNNYMYTSNGIFYIHARCEGSGATTTLLPDRFGWLVRNGSFSNNSVMCVRDGFTLDFYIKQTLPAHASISFTVISESSRLGATSYTPVSSANATTTEITASKYSDDIGAVSVATSATKLSTARTINGVSFDGTANITIPLKTASSGKLLVSTTAEVGAGSISGTISGLSNYAAFLVNLTVKATSGSTNAYCQLVLPIQYVISSGYYPDVNLTFSDGTVKSANIACTISGNALTLKQQVPGAGSITKMEVYNLI